MADPSVEPERADPRTRVDDARLARYASEGDPDDLEALVLRYRPLALGLARRYAGPLRSMDDLAQVACVGLIKALRRFDPQRGCPFATYAVPTILGELRRYCRDTHWTLHVPRGMQERIIAVRRAADVVTAARGRTATVSEVAVELGWDRETVVEALVAGSTRSTIPLETEVGDAADPCQLIEFVGDVDPGFELAESLIALEGSMGALTTAEKRVLRLRFEDDLKLHEVASRLALPESRVARLLASALGTLRNELGLADEDDTVAVPPRVRRRKSGPRVHGAEPTGIAA
ncbi:MAG: RNA polymerase sigma factor SigB [uncultured Solirubrobacteraceae bacterium]|uniref:RNA polymerase sigma factor SigB n=1 Tax=uncultured Solirubrobacteraceae bacterium TaxID=1162706 RepID=A0A6J4SDM0_9ACTN|nr:MAG: RNA polymerase sigma factor SigB [uncultured Solirubrobacteraceae bacterium]